MTKKDYGYATRAAELLDACLTLIRDTRHFKQRHVALYDMEHALAQTERLLNAYFIQLIDLEREKIEQLGGDTSSSFEQQTDVTQPGTLVESMQVLQATLDTRRRQEIIVKAARGGKHRSPQRPRQTTLGEVARTTTKQGPRPFVKDTIWPEDNENITVGTTISQQAAGDSSYSSGRSRSYYPTRNATDTLLFRLITTLELCLVRLGDAHFVVTGRRPGKTATRVSYFTLSRVVTVAACVGVGSFWLSRKERPPKVDLTAVAKVSGQTVVSLLVGKLASRKWGDMWMTTKIVNSTVSIEHWQHEWLLVQSSSSGEASSGGACDEDSRSQRLIEHALSESPKSSFWHSEGEIRFLFLRRAMDLLYASIGTAVEVTKGKEGPSAEVGSIWRIPLAAAAAASYYSVTGPHRRASQAVDSSASDVIQYAWGMVSLPSVKNMSLKATQLLKGAAIAERLVVAGVPCFILSGQPFPDLAAAIRRSKRKEQRKTIKKLSTIYEQGESEKSIASCSATSLNLLNNPSFSKKDVIFHLTGGGFFAHTIASDLPYLLDWSNATGAVVICPEYALLPEYPYPAALKEISDVYRFVLSGEASVELGFDVDRIIVTGESAGGNLAAALCVKLITGNLVDLYRLLKGPDDDDETQGQDGDDESPFEDDEDEDDEGQRQPGEQDHQAEPAISYVSLPDALMLSCPALNLSLELTPSRIRGHEDPVLPSGLISAISDAYIPKCLGISKKDPLVSPFYAPDDVLRFFPPTLLFASSDDPLLDDSVIFNKRLRQLGVDSDLRAAHNMPHAYWGLGTAGFPEAKQVQHECEEFLVKQFGKD